MTASSARYRKPFRGRRPGKLARAWRATAGLAILACLGTLILPDMTARSQAQSQEARILPASSASPETDAPGGLSISDALVAVRLSEDLIQRRIERTIVRHTPVQQVILDSNVHGQARTEGRLSLDLVPGKGAAEMYFVFAGTSVAHTVGRQSAVEIYTTTTTHFTARKRLSFDLPEGFGHAPAIIESRTERQTTGIRPLVPGLRGCLVRKIAARRLQQNSVLLDAISHHNAHSRISSSFETAAREKLDSLNGYVWAVAPALQEIRRVRQEKLDLYSSDSSLLLVLRRAEPEGDDAGEGPARGELRPLLTVPAESQSGALAEVWVHSSWDQPRRSALKPIFYAVTQILADMRADEEAPVRSLRSQFRRLPEPRARGTWTLVELHENLAAAPTDTVSR